MLKVANSVINASRITGVLPVVNGGTGVTTSTGTGSVVLSAAPTLSGDVALSTGNLVISTSGKGIDFSADPAAAGMTSELLDDYEEGTWTATLTASAGAPTTPVTETGTYTKVGRQVTVTCSFNARSLAGSSGDVQITGLPFTVGSQDCHGVCGNNSLSGGSLMCTAAAGSVLLAIRSLDTTVFTPTVAGTVYVLATVTYFV